MRIAVFVFAVIGAVGCASAPRLRVQQTNESMGNPPASPLEVGTCAATIRVRVVDAQRRPAVGAEVVAVRVIASHAPSMVPSVATYRSLPVRTDAKGDARVCNPDRLHDIGSYDFANVRTSVIEARSGTDVGTIAAPFVGPLLIGPRGILTP